MWNKRWKFHRTHSFLLDHALINLCHCLSLASAFMFILSSFLYLCARYTCRVLPYVLHCYTTSEKMNTVFTWMQDFFLKFGSNMWGHLKFACEVLNHTTPIQVALNQILQSHTMACIAKSSCEIAPVVRYYAALRGNSIPTFWDMSVPPSRANKFNREKRAWLNLTDTVFFFGLVHRRLF